MMLSQLADLGALLLLLNRGFGIYRTSSSLRDYIPSGTEQTEHNQNQERNTWHRGLLTGLVTLDLHTRQGLMQRRLT